MAGIFDFFKKKKPVEERGLSVPLPKASIFDAFRPPEQPPQLPAVRPETLPAAPAAAPPKRLPGILRIFEAFAPAPVPPPAPQLPAIPEEPAPAAPAVWERMFGPPAPVEEPPVTAMFPAPAPEAALPVEAPAPTPFMAPAERHPRYTFIRIPRLPPGTGEWRFPPPGQLAIHLRQHFMLDDIFRALAERRQSGEWSQSLVERARLGQPVVVPVDPVVHKNLYTDFAKLFNIPWDVVESYIGPARTD